MAPDTTRAEPPAPPLRIEEALAFDLGWVHSEKAVRGVALGTNPIRRVRSPDAHEAEIAAHCASAWAERRVTTTPGPFGDLPQLEALVGWMEEYGVENAVAVNHRESVGTQGYGRPNELSERGAYAFAGLVALWLGRLPEDAWPASLKDRRPARPDAALMSVATLAARILAAKVITRPPDWFRGWLRR